MVDYSYQNLTAYLESKKLEKKENYAFSMRQFILYYGEHWEEPFLDFYATVKDKCYLELGEDYINTSTKFPLDPVNTNLFWTKTPEKAKKFIHVVGDYRDNPDTKKDEQLLNFAKNINNDPLRYIYEIIQNADDCAYADHITRAFSLDLSEPDKIIAKYNELGMNYLDIIALTSLGKSSKHDPTKKQIGEKGIGFKTIFSPCRQVDVYSGGYSFTLNGKNFQPTYLEGKPEDSGTTLVLHLKKMLEVEEGKEVKNKLSQDVFLNLLEQYGFEQEGNTWQVNPQKAFQQCPILFTNHLDSISLRKNDLCFTVKRSKTPSTEPSQGNFIPENLTLTYLKGNTVLYSLDCFQLRKGVDMSEADYLSRYPEQEPPTTDALTYDIAIVAPKTIPDMEKDSFSGNLYSFLPTSTYIKAPFNLQIPLKLNLDRSSMWCHGDQDTTVTEEPREGAEVSTILWNQKLWAETYVFLEEFYQYLQYKVDVVAYAPDFKQNNHHLFVEKEKVYAKSVDNLNLFCKNVPSPNCEKNLFDTFAQIPYFKGEKKFYTAEESAMFDVFIMDTFQDSCQNSYFDQWNRDKGQKHLVEYNPKAEKLEAWCPNFLINIETEKEKNALLNQSFQTTDQRNKVLQAYTEEKSPSVYLPQKPWALEIFLPHRQREANYLAFLPPEGGKRFWFYSDPVLKSYGTGMLCFWNIDPDFYTKFYQKCKAIQDPMEVFSHLQSQNLNQEEIQELMHFLMENLKAEGDWNSYTQAVLKGEKGEHGWEDPQVKALAKMILNAKGGQSHE